MLVAMCSFPQNKRIIAPVYALDPIRSDYVGLPRKRKRNPGADDTNCVMILFFFIIIVFIA